MVRTKIIGILNATPDSFYALSRCDGHEGARSEAIAYAKRLQAGGADLIDIGGESTRPGASPVPLEVEFQRVVPLIKELRSHITIPLSIDTMKPEIAIAALEAGASFINNTGLNSVEMFEVAASFEVPICVMHNRPQPLNYQEKTFYEEGAAEAILRWFELTVTKLISAGVKEQKIILDPGIGFGKTVADNFEILHNLPKLQAFGFPLLLGISRKSFLGKTLNLPSPMLLPATLALNARAIEYGIDYIRVHDVKEHKEVALVLEAVKAQEKKF